MTWTFRVFTGNSLHNEVYAGSGPNNLTLPSACTVNLYHKVQFCLSILTPLKLLQVQASNLPRLIFTPW